MTGKLSPKGCVGLVQAKVVKGQECFWQKKQLSVILLRRKRALCVGGTEKNLMVGHSE